MRSYVLRLFPLALAPFLFVGCNGCPRTEHTAQFSTSAIRKLADEAALKNGVNLTHFAPPAIHFELGDHDCMWSASYEANYPSAPIDSGFTVYINDVTGNVFLHGQP